MSTQKTTTANELTKAQEKQLIEKLMNGYGYFADEFNAEDKEMMTSNIGNDFPIFNGTSLGDKIEMTHSLSREVANLKASMTSRETRIDDLEKENKTLQMRLENILSDLLRGTDPAEIKEFNYTKTEILVATLDCGLTLTAEQTRYIKDRIL